MAKLSGDIVKFWVFQVVKRSLGFKGLGHLVRTLLSSIYLKPRLMHLIIAPITKSPRPRSKGAGAQGSRYIRGLGYYQHAQNAAVPQLPWQNLRNPR